MRALPLLFLSIATARAFELAASHPAHGAENVPVSASLHLRFSDALKPDTLSFLKLKEVGGGEVESQRSTDLTNASITLAPVEFLRAGSRYEILGSARVQSVAGVALQPFKLEFGTSAVAFDPSVRLQFVQGTFDTTRSMTTVVFGPDRRLYAASAFGELVCWDVDADSGRPRNRRPLLQDPAKGRQYIDLEWDSGATAGNLVLWASYAERLSDSYFTGTIARLVIEGGRVREERSVVTGLPHGREMQGGFDTLPHQPNGLCFRDGKLYQSVGSTSSSGGPANWGVAEQALSAAIIEIDYKQIRDTLDVASFDPNQGGQPVRVFATGVRNALEIVAHSNGRLYTAVNINDRGGRGDGVPDHPEIPGDQNALVKTTTPDHESLLILERGRHYGFPNPSRRQFVLGGGNPTAGADPFEIAGYPVGTKPDTGFAPELMYPIWRWGGTSPDGMIEYSPDSEGSLSGTLMCCFYSAGDIAVMTLGSDGLPTAIEKLRGPEGKLRFAGPLDITQDPATGNLYVADFGKQSKFGADGSMAWLRPVFARGGELAVTDLGKLSRAIPAAHDRGGSGEKWPAVRELLGGELAERVIVQQTAADLGGSTSVRNEVPLVWKKQGYYQRGRDLGQVFTAPEDFILDAIVLRTGNSDSAFLSGTGGAPVFVQFFSVGGEPVIDDNGTPPGTEATHGFSKNHRCDDFVTGVEYEPLAVARGGVLPNLKGDGKLNYMKWDLRGDAELRFRKGRRYAFMVGIEEPGAERGFTLANSNAAASPRPPAMDDGENPYGGGWGLRREGNGKRPTMHPDESPPSDERLREKLWDESLFPTGAARFAVPPTCDGYPDVDTYRDLEFYLIRRSAR